MARFLFSLLLFLAFVAPVNAQINPNKSELITAPKKHSPKKATLYSAVIPGLGQIYNKKYWKVPIVYAGIGTMTYFIVTNRTIFLQAKEAYNYAANESDYPTDNPFVVKFTEGTYDKADLLEIRDYYRRSMELSWILMGVWYVLNIIDANVDAHFFDYDISDNLTLHLQPMIEPDGYPGKPIGNTMQTGMVFRITF
jgi:hypothetical protein